MQQKTKNGLFAVLLIVSLIVTMLVAWAVRDTSFGKGSHHIDQVRPGGVLPHQQP